MYRGWIPHDEGTLAQSAERVLQGELPHRDFDDVYTGGLSYLHAAAMAAFGVNLRSLRLTLFGFFVLWVPACYAIARRFASPVPAGLVTLTAVAWSLPNYFAGLPSWYNLFFATFGVLAFLKFIETDHRRWLIVAGVWGGLSVLMKIVGAYYLAGGLLCLAYMEQNRPAPHRQERGWSLVYATFVGVSCVAFVGVLLISVRIAAQSRFLPGAVCSQSWPLLCLWSMASGRQARGSCWIAHADYSRSCRHSRSGPRFRSGCL